MVFAIFITEISIVDTIFLLYFIVVDTVPPTITNCPSSFTVTVELGTTREAVTWTEPTASDLSGTVTLVQRTSSPNSLFVVGSTAVTYTFSDNSGNSAECTFTVTVVAGEFLSSNLLID